MTGGRRSVVSRGTHRSACGLLLTFGMAGATGAATTANPAPEGADPARVVEAVELSGVEGSVGALLLSGQRGGTVDGAQLWSVADVGTDRATWQVPLLIEVDGGDLLAGHSGSRIPLAVYAFAVDRDGRIADHIAQGVVLPTSEYAAQLAAGGLRFRGRLELPPGMFSVRVMVRNHATGRYYLSWTAVRTPELGSRAMDILPPILEGIGDEWIVALESGVPPDVPVIPGGPTDAAARPALVNREASEMLVGIIGWPRDGGRIEAVVRNDQGRTVAEPSVTVGEEPAAAADTVEFRRLRVEAVDLPAGEYTLVLTAEDGTGERRVRSLPIEVLPEDRQVAWCALDVAPPVPEEAVAEPEEVEELKRKEMRALYESALGMLAAGRAREAAHAVADLERRALARNVARGLQLLERVERAEALRLVETDPRAVVPLAALHRDLYRAYVARNEAVLAGHSWELAANLAEIAARRQPDPVPAGFAEAVLVGLASDLVQGSALMSARSLLDRTLALSPANPAALLALGAVEERSADYPGAVDAFRRLARTRPENAEGNLRLAINLLRLGEDGEAGARLRELVDGSPPHWVAALAYQELAVLLVSEKQLEGARSVLVRGIEAVPGNQRLKIQLAYVLDLMGRAREATGLLEDLDRTPSGEGDSPRVLYARWPSLGPEVSQSTVDRMAREAAPGLQRALDGTGRR